jgi:hypothetical protein
MLRSGFISRCDLEQGRFVERTAKKFDADRNLIGLGAFQSAAVRVIDVRDTIVNFSGESGRHDDGRESADRAQVHAPAAAGAAPQIQISFQCRSPGSKFASESCVPAFRIRGSVCALYTSGVRLAKTMCGGMVL